MSFIPPRILFLSIIPAALLLARCGRVDKISLDWQELNSPTNLPITDILFLDTDTGFITAGIDWTVGELWETHDGGQTWRPILYTDRMLTNLELHPAGSSVSVSGFAGRHALRQNGVWSEERRLPIFNPFMDEATWDGERRILVSGGNFDVGDIALLNGNSAILSELDFSHDLEAVDFADSLTAVASGYGIMLRTTDAGDTWQPLDITSDYFKDIQFLPSGTGYSCGFGGSILKTSDAGLHWHEIRNGDRLFVSDKRFNALHFADEDRGVIVGENGLCWRTSDGGSRWEDVKNLPGYDYLEAFMVAGRTYLVSRQGNIVIM